MRYFLGIDPGFYGALVILDFQGQIQSFIDMPLLKRANGKNLINGQAIIDFIHPLSKVIRVAVIEEVAARPREGVSSSFRFGYGCGLLHGLIQAHGIPVIFTPPAVWKPKMGLDASKENSLRKAQEVWDGVVDPKTGEGAFRLMKHHDRAEAGFLAEFGRQAHMSGALGPVEPVQGH